MVIPDSLGKKVAQHLISPFVFGCLDHNWSQWTRSPRCQFGTDPI